VPSTWSAFHSRQGKEGGTFEMEERGGPVSAAENGGRFT